MTDPQKAALEALEILFKEASEHNEISYKVLEDARDTLKSYLTHLRTSSPVEVTVEEFKRGIGSFAGNKTFLSHEEVCDYVRHFQNGLRIIPAPPQAKE